MDIFYREKEFKPWKKSGKMTLPPQKKILLRPCVHFELFCTENLDVYTLDEKCIMCEWLY